jgi:coenzyme F420 hydrogenase subunit beta
LEHAAARGFKRLAIIGVPCQVHALRALQPELGLDELYVVGTPCSDNTSTEHFHQFLALLTDRPEAVTYLEFMPDLHVEMRFTDGTSRRIPFVKLPISKLPADFIPLTCRSCFDYANSLADITVGYLAAEGDQWLLVRNERGRSLLRLLDGELETKPLRSAGHREGPVRGFLDMTVRSTTGLPVRRAPNWVRPILAWAMPRFGPRGLEFGRARIEMKHLEGIVNLRRHQPHRLRRMVPDFAWALAAPYGITPTHRERPSSPESV